MSFALILSEDFVAFIFLDNYISLDNFSNDDLDVSLTKREDKNAFIQVMIRIYEKKNLMNDTLWEQFKEDFQEWTEEDFKDDVLNIRLRRLRNVLRKRDVWVLKNNKIIIARSLVNILQEENSTLWIEDEIRACIKLKKFIFNSIKHLLKTDFDRNSKNYFWQAQSQSESKESSRESQDSSTRERSITKKSVKSMQKQLMKKVMKNEMKKKQTEN